jgi:DNA-3-methyladenine glycosylase I
MSHRCTWATKEVFHAYHDDEWGVPVHDDNRHFEMLVLEGAQAGLSWETILKKRDAYRDAFYGFDPKACAELTDDYLESLLKNPGIIRNRLKVFSVRKNAIAFLEIQKALGSFDAYIWGFVGGKPIVNAFKSLKEIPPSTEVSDAISKNLKKRGMSFVGTTIVYAYMQAIGMVNDHEVRCFRYNAC